MTTKRLLKQGDDDVKVLTTDIPLPKMTPMEWVELEAEMGASQLRAETFREKAIRRTMANPIAPIGELLLTFSMI